MSLSCQFLESVTFMSVSAESSLDMQPIFPEPPTRQDRLIQGDAPSGRARLPGPSIVVR